MDEQLLRRIKGEFTEMPGLLLTVAQAKRLWHLDERTCVAALNALVESNFLVQRRNGSFTRAAEGQFDIRPAMARAQLAKIHRAS
ncbi:MAG TPA: hypothetical protein VH497_14900 [Vicinamibacterales bacterium]|jgi:hypothetical protein